VVLKFVNGSRAWEAHKNAGVTGRGGMLVRFPVIQFLQKHLFLMPLYEYHCPKCGRTFELLRRMQDADDELKCPHCGSKKTERQFSTFSAGGCGSGGSGRFT
jgi:putative FmdB family regulatory protein